VLPGVPIQIPNAPIKIAPVGEKLRLVMLPAPQAATFGQLGTGQFAAGQLATPGLGGAVNGVVLGTGNAPVEAPLAPLVVDIPLAPN
jgi:hypothetical protein